MSTDRTTASVGTQRMRVLVSLLGAFEVLMAVGAASALIRVVGIVGGLALAAAPWVTGRARGVAFVLLVVGTVPFAALTATSLVPPALATVAWVLMGLLHRDRTNRVPAAPDTGRRSTHQAGIATT
jgi:hypothetical protein